MSDSDCPVIDPDKRPKTATEALRMLQEFFPPDQIRWRPQGAKSREASDSALVVPYISSRAVMDRLDSVFGPENWESAYRELSGGQIECTLSVLFPGAQTWVRRCDVGARTNMGGDPDDNIKAAYSDAMKRAAVQLSIGRYLYAFGRMYAKWDGFKLVSVPTIPPQFLPHEYRPAGSDYADRALKLVSVLIGKRGGSSADHSEYVTQFLRSSGVNPSTPLANVQRRIVTRLLERANADIAGAAAGVVTLPDGYPKTGEELKTRLMTHDAKLAKEGRTNTGALLSHVVRSVNKGSDIASWNDPDTITRAVRSAIEFDKANPTKKPDKAATA